MNDARDSLLDRMSQPDAWNVVAEGYNRDIRQHIADFVKEGLSSLELTREMRVIDVACGPGTTALQLAPLVKQVCAVDFAENMLRQLEGNLKASGVSNVEAVCADGQKLPYQDGSFDAAVSMFGVMFFHDRPQGFSELARVVRPGGQTLVSSWAPSNPTSASMLLARALQAADPKNRQLIDRVTALRTKESLKDEMLAAGFEDVQVREIDQDVEFDSVWDFWHSAIDGSTSVQILREKLSEAEWREQSERAANFLEKECGNAKLKLLTRAFLGHGIKA